jgi:hypothetical protein
MCACVFVCVRAHVCVWERERERDGHAECCPQQPFKYNPSDDSNSLPSSFSFQTFCHAVNVLFFVLGDSPSISTKGLPPPPAAAAAVLLFITVTLTLPESTFWKNYSYRNSAFCDLLTTLTFPQIHARRTDQQFGLILWLERKKRSAEVKCVSICAIEVSALYESPVTVSLQLQPQICEEKVR